MPRENTNNGSAIDIHGKLNIEEHGGFCGTEADCQGNLHLFHASI
jgi:hypothetical protein